MWWFVIGAIAVLLVLAIGTYTFVKNRKEREDLGRVTSA